MHSRPMHGPCVPMQHTHLQARDERRLAADALRGAALLAVVGDVGLLALSLV